MLYLCKWKEKLKKEEKAHGVELKEKGKRRNAMRSDAPQGLLTTHYSLHTTHYSLHTNTPTLPHFSFLISHFSSFLPPFSFPLPSLPISFAKVPNRKCRLKLEDTHFIKNHFFMKKQIIISD